MTLSASDALAMLNTLAQFPDAAGSKAAWIAILQAAGPVDPATFIVGDPSERFLEVGGRAMGAWGKVPTQAAKGLFLHLQTDPGDVDDFGNPDLSADQSPRPGFLSAAGLSMTGVERGEQSYAVAFVTIKNNGSSPTLPFAPGQLDFEYTGASRRDGGTPTYTNTADPSIYTGIGGTLPPLAPGATLATPIPVQARQIGSYGSAGLNAIDLVVTQSYGALVVTASTVAIGQEREARGAYLARCDLAADKLAPGGPTQAYRFAMNTRRDGKPLLRFDGSGPVTITQAYVSPASADSEVTIYYGGLAGAVDDIDVSSANANICGLQLLGSNGVDHNPDPVGCLPDCVLLLPTNPDPNTGSPGGASCINTVVRVHWSAKVPSAKMGSASPGTYATPWHASTAYSVGQKVGNGTKLYVVTGAGTSASSGGPTGTGTGISDGSATWDYAGTGIRPNTAAVTAALATVASALGTYLLSTGIGGLDQVSGAGVVYTTGLVPAVNAAVSGFYDPLVTVPSAASTAIPVGHIAAAPDQAHKDVQGTITGVLVVA